MRNARRGGRPDRRWRNFTVEGFEGLGAVDDRVEDLALGAEVVGVDVDVEEEEDGVGGGEHSSVQARLLPSGDMSL